MAVTLLVSACLSDPSPTPVPSASTAPSPVVSVAPPASAEASGGPTVTEPPSSSPTPSPSDPPSDAPEATPTSVPTPRPSDDETLVIMAPDHPRRLLTADFLNPAERLLVDVLYDPLYRLDEDMEPVPELARQLPTVTKGGTVWTIPIRADASFHSGRKVRDQDVAFSLRMAKSASCPLGHTLCQTVRTYVERVDVSPDEREVTITLTEPYQPFLAEVLGRLPILSRDGVTAATEDLVDDASRIDAERPDRVISRIYEQTLRDECAEPEPPKGCRLPDHRAALEAVFERARVELPSEAPYIDATGRFDEDAYLGGLLRRLESLAQVLDTEGQDESSAALGLLDVTVGSFGSGPYTLAGIGDDGTYRLEANPAHTRTVAKIPALEVRVERNPAIATTRLLNGEADWILETNAEQAEVIASSAGFAAASRPLDTQFGILFNVRPERVYFDYPSRRAFVQCIDHPGLATALDDERHLATTPYTASSWARPDVAVRERDVQAAIAALEAGGWMPGPDGVRVHEDGRRLSSSIVVRPTSVALFTFANQAAEQLAECGIELKVEELDLTGDAMLRQLVYPNDFDTLMWTRRLGPDPDGAVRAFESARRTRAANPADENPSGFTSAIFDYWVEQGRVTGDQGERIEAYAKAQEELQTNIPYWPLWYDSQYGAVSSRLRDGGGAVDPSGARYDWDISSWSLRPLDPA
jgi:ABC-type transport system substrate-binding protein